MPALIQRADQIVTLTTITRRGTEYFKALQNRKTDRLIITNNAEPIAIIFEIKQFEAMLDEIESLQREVELLKKR